MVLMVWVCAAARPKILRVGNPATTSRKCPASTERVPHWRSIFRCAARPTNTMKIGMSGSVSAIVTPATRSAWSTQISTAVGTRQARTSCGKYREK
jgi:hypothetical protein